MIDPQWLNWAQRLQAIAQTGLHYEPHPFDRERYEQIEEIAAEMLAAHTNDDPQMIRDLFQAQAGHATPKVDVRGVVFRDDAVLLVRENLDNGRWTLPGGWADIGEAPAEAVAREVYEEAGYRVQVTRMLAVYDRSRHNYPPSAFYIYKLFFLCELLDDKQVDGYNDLDSAAFAETGEARFFTEDNLPEDLSTGRVTLAQLKRFFALHRQPDLPTDFD